MPVQHKVTMTRDPAVEAAEVLSRILTDLSHHRDLQEPYRRSLVDERSTFDQEVRQAFIDPQVLPSR